MDEIILLCQEAERVIRNNTLSISYLRYVILSLNKAEIYVMRPSTHVILRRVWFRFQRELVNTMKTDIYTLVITREKYDEERRIKTCYALLDGKTELSVEVPM